MHIHDLRKIIEAVPYDFEVHIETPVNIAKYTAEVKAVYIDFENKLLVIGDKKQWQLQQVLNLKRITS